MADTRSKSLFAKAMVREVDETFGSGIDKLEETIADQNAKIGERIHALLLLLRSRNAEEENLQVNARPASSQLSESPDFNRPEPKPNYGVNVTPDAPNASSLLSNRKYKIQRRISCEEIDERRLKGLCVFCEEPETPNHHLQHKNSGILMIDSEDHLSNAMEFEEIGVEISSDMWLSNSFGCELETGETDYDEDQCRFLIDSDLVVNEVEMMKKDLVEMDVAKSCDEEQFSDNGKVFGFNIEESETYSWIEQNQLIQEQADIHPTDSVMEPSLESSDQLLSKGNDSLASEAELIQQLEPKDCAENLSQVVLQTKLELIHTKMLLPFFIINTIGVSGTAENFRELPTISNKSYAFKLLGKMSLHQGSQNMKKKMKASKSWMFKYKNQKLGIKSLHNQDIYLATLCDCKTDFVVEVVDWYGPRRSGWWLFQKLIMLKEEPASVKINEAISFSEFIFGVMAFHIWHKWKSKHLHAILEWNLFLKQCFSASSCAVSPQASFFGRVCGFVQKNKSLPSWTFQCKCRDVWEELFHITSKETIERDLNHYFLLIVAAHWSTQIHFGDALLFELLSIGNCAQAALLESLVWWNELHIIEFSGFLVSWVKQEYSKILAVVYFGTISGDELSWYVIEVAMSDNYLLARLFITRRAASCRPKMQKSHALFPDCCAFQNKNLAFTQSSTCVLIVEMTDKMQGTFLGRAGSKKEIRESERWHSEVNTKLRPLVYLDDMFKFYVGMGVYNRRLGAEIEHPIHLNTYWIMS